MSAAGFYLMQRGWMDDDFFQSVRREPFDHRSAWIWLLEHAAHAAHAVNFHGKSVSLERGQLVTSLLNMGGAWGWNTTKVARVVRALRDRCMIVTATVTAGTVITICNYDELQGSGQVTVTPTVLRTFVHRLPTVTGENNGEQLKTKKDSRSSPRGETIIDQDFEAWWKECPRKIAKGAGLRAYRTARKSAEVGELLDGIKRYAASRAGEDAQFTSHPATWLNGKRWLDQPGGTEPQERDRPKGPPPPLTPEEEEIWRQIKTERGVH